MDLSGFLQFLDDSPTMFHAAKKIKQAFLEAHFTPLTEGEKWKLEPGKGYFVQRDGSLTAAFRMPKEEIRSAILLASHLDSPCLKLKPEGKLAGPEGIQLGTEVYGAPLLHTWLDRELIIAGRICNAKGESTLVRLDQSPVIIPSLAIHLDRSIHEKGILVHKHDHLKPFFSLKNEAKELEELFKAPGFDLFLTPREKSSYLGQNQEMIASARLDNLSSAYASLYALLHAETSSHRLQMSFFWDHEEIGSVSFVGADSSFASQLLERIALASKMNREDEYRMRSGSLILSVDLAHGYNPNFADKYDALNSPRLGKGVVLKFNANQKYATSGLTGAFLQALAQQNKIALQRYANRSDIPSGSTVGSMMAATTGIATLDLGIGGWAMHSARETIAAADEMALCALLTAALEVDHA